MVSVVYHMEVLMRLPMSSMESKFKLNFCLRGAKDLSTQKRETWKSFLQIFSQTQTIFDFRAHDEI